MEYFDIIIAGGGPAGMSAAAELSKNHSVLVLERCVPGTTNATWISYMDRVNEHGLEEAVAFSSDHMRFVAPSSKHDMKDKCVVLNHNKVMNIFMKRAENNGALIRQESFEGYVKDSDGVLVATDKCHYKGSLLIDATGGKSKIVELHNLVRRVDAWVLYGARIKVSNSKRPARIEYLPLNDEANTYVGIHPYNETETNFYIFKGQNNTWGDPSEMEQQFKEVLEQEYPGAEIIQNLSGTIPSGILKKYALDNVIFWGAAGMLNPDGCGMGFNEILRQLKVFSAEITRTLKANHLSEKDLSYVAESLRDVKTMHFQRIIGAFSLYFIKSKGKWDGGIKWLNAMGDDSKCWMRNEMSLDWIRTATLKLHKSVPFSETIKMIPPNELFFITDQLIRFSFAALSNSIKKALGYLGGRKNKQDTVVATG